jgi:hypothetical protein
VAQKTDAQKNAPTSTTPKARKLSPLIARAIREGVFGRRLDETETIATTATVTPVERGVLTTSLEQVVNDGERGKKIAERLRDDLERVTGLLESNAVMLRDSCNAPRTRKTVIRNTLSKQDRFKLRLEMIKRICMACTAPVILPTIEAIIRHFGYVINKTADIALTGLGGALTYFTAKYMYKKYIEVRDDLLLKRSREYSREVEEVVKMAQLDDISLLTKFGLGVAMTKDAPISDQFYTEALATTLTQENCRKALEILAKEKPNSA